MPTLDYAGGGSGPVPDLPEFPMGELRQRWPEEAARDKKWIALDAAHRSRYTGEAVWRQRHSDAVSAQKLRALLWLWPCLFAMKYVPKARDYVPFLAWVSVVGAVVVEVAVFLAMKFFELNHWRSERGLTWTRLALTFCPDGVESWWRKRTAKKRAGSEGSEGRAASVGPAPPGSAAQDASPATAASPVPKCLPPINCLPPPQQPPLHWTGRQSSAAGSPHSQYGAGTATSVPLGGSAASYSMQPAAAGWGQASAQGMAQSPPLFGASPRFSATPGALPTPDVCRSLAYGSPHSADPSGAFGLADMVGDFRFRASPMTQEKPAVPLAQLVDDSYRAILRLTNKESTSLLAEGSSLQREIFSHLVLLDKQITEVEKGIKDMKEFHGLNMQQFSCAHPLTEPLERGAQAAPAPAPAAPGGFGGFGAAGGLGGGFGGGFGAKPPQPQVTSNKEEGLRNVLAPLSTELNAWGGDRPGKGDQVRMKHVLLRRMRLERALCIENNFPTATHSEYNKLNKIKQWRAHRAKYVARLKSIVSEGYHEGRKDTNDAEIVLHAFAALLDVSYFGGRVNVCVEWAGAGGAVLRYSNNRCPGFLQLNVETTSYQGMTIYVLKHVDSDLGVNTTYFTNPSRSLYEALYFFLLIFESKHPNKPHTAIDHENSFSGSQSLFSYLSRQFILEAKESGVV